MILSLTGGKPVWLKGQGKLILCFAPVTLVHIYNILSGEIFLTINVTEQAHCKLETRRDKESNSVEKNWYISIKIPRSVSVKMINMQANNDERCENVFVLWQSDKCDWRVWQGGKRRYIIYRVQRRDISLPTSWQGAVEHLSICSARYH